MFLFLFCLVIFFELVCVCACPCFDCSTLPLKYWPNSRKKDITETRKNKFNINYSESLMWTFVLPSPITHKI